MTGSQGTGPDGLPGPWRQPPSSGPAPQLASSGVPPAGPWLGAAVTQAGAAAGGAVEAGGLSAFAATDFFAAQRANRRRTMALLALLTAIAASLGYLAGWYLDAASGSAAGMDYVSGTGALAALGIGAVSVGWSTVSLAWGGRMVLAMTGATEVTRASEPQLFNVVEEMSIAAGQPVPRVYVIEDEALNAFATGTSSRNAAIGVTRGLLNALNREELQGVVGHEMGHIANLDTRYMTVVGVTVGLVALISDMILRFMNWGTGRSRDRSRGGNGGAAAILLVVLVIVAVVAPIAARLVQFAVSRQREYLADATAVQFTRNPAGLISALQKLTAAARPFAGVSRATQHLFIVNPLHQFGSTASALMATHPATEDRIARLQALGRR